MHAERKQLQVVYKCDASLATLLGSKVHAEEVCLFCTPCQKVVMLLSQTFQRDLM